MADGQPETVVLAAGKSSIVRTARLTGSESVNFVIAAGERQVLSIRFAPDHPACFMNVWAPGADEATHVGTLAGHDFVANLARVGVYRVQAYLAGEAAKAGDACSFEVTFHLTAAGAALPLPTVPQGRDALRGAVEKCLEMVGTPAEIVSSTMQRSGLYALALRELDSGRQSVCTVRDDGTIEDWTER